MLIVYLCYVFPALINSLACCILHIVRLSKSFETKPGLQNRDNTVLLFPESWQQLILGRNNRPEGKTWRNKAVKYYLSKISVKKRIGTCQGNNLRHSDVVMWEPSACRNQNAQAADAVLFVEITVTRRINTPKAASCLFSMSATRRVNN